MCSACRATFEETAVFAKDQATLRISLTSNLKHQRGISVKQCPVAVE